MDITHDLLISLGFVKDPRRADRYKGVIGSLHQPYGLFLFEGFAPTIGTVTDLQYLLLLIDYKLGEYSINL